MKSEETNNLMHVLVKCITACETCATECLKEEHVNAMERCITLNRDCADICNVLIRYIARDSEYTNDILEECIDICKACADECRKHDHWHCQKCAEICQECLQACEGYVIPV